MYYKPNYVHIKAAKNFEPRFFLILWVHRPNLSLIKGKKNQRKEKAKCPLRRIDFKADFLTTSRKIDRPGTKVR